MDAEAPIRRTLAHDSPTKKRVERTALLRGTATTSAPTPTPFSGRCSHSSERRVSPGGVGA